ncbi:MAG: glycosyltransferase family 4 protein [Nostoc sp.]|uniref:glycosyltransferase family 4 protein n=1 Tax=Nostoc sp. TaxID=1180 RepID=UPI002FF061C7
MKIVFVNPVGVIGGAERVLLTILAALLIAQPNMQLHLIIGTDGPLREQAKKLGVQVTLLEIPEEFNQLGDSAFKGNSKAIAILILLSQIVKILPSIGKYLREFNQLVHELNPDLIHSNGIKTHFLTALVGVKGIPIVWHIHDFYGSRPLIAQALKLMNNRATFGIAVSQAVAQDARTTLPGLPIEVIYNAIDIDYFSPAPQSSHLPLRVGLVATFARWKGHDIFLEAASHIVKAHPNLNLHFWIVGEPIYKTRGSQFSQQELKNKASYLGIASKVSFLSFQQDIAEIYRWLDIVVHASTQPEPFGLAIVEAMACGRPVIISKAGGAAELFTHNYDAIAIPPGEPIALAAAILDLHDNPEKCQVISEKARRTVIENFNHERLSRQIMAVYNKFNYK